MLTVGLCLNLALLYDFYNKNDGFQRGFVLQSVKKQLELMDKGNLVWPANGTKFDNTFAVYGRFMKIEFCVMCITVGAVLRRLVRY